MHSDRIGKCFNDIIAAIDLIRRWVSEAGGLEAAIHHNELVRSAIERQLLVISEAAIRLDSLDVTCAPTLAPTIDWPGIRGIGNFIRHKYDELDTAIIADAIANRLMELRSAAEKALKQLPRE
ncbi:MAG TPA: HepT-like ribonuclease domain-containing protein [Rhizomicrobium sp.]|jgi:uncharacterized protein with HEPN domain|nr:HepT-like ribonuclease domain-containing protein [Rhizomicrobium sp.]